MVRGGPPEVFTLNKSVSTAVKVDSNFTSEIFGTLFDTRVLPGYRDSATSFMGPWFKQEESALNPMDGARRDSNLLCRVFLLRQREWQQYCVDHVNNAVTRADVGQ